MNKAFKPRKREISNQEFRKFITDLIRINQDAKIKKLRSSGVIK